jgi:hypothetical protein
MSLTEPIRIGSAATAWKTHRRAMDPPLTARTGCESTNRSVRSTMDRTPHFYGEEALAGGIRSVPFDSGGWCNCPLFRCCEYWTFALCPERIVQGAPRTATIRSKGRQAQSARVVKVLSSQRKATGIGRRSTRQRSGTTLEWRERTRRGGPRQKARGQHVRGRTWWEVMRYGNPIDRSAGVVRTRWWGLGILSLARVAGRWPFTC